MDILFKLFSFMIGLMLSYGIFVFLNKRNCIILSSNLSTKILNEKIYNKKKQKCYTFSKKNKKINK